MNSSKMLLLSTIIMFGFFSVVKTELSAAEKSVTQAFKNAIESCDKDDKVLFNNARQLETLLQTLTPAQLDNILSDSINNISQKNKTIDCENCKRLEEDVKTMLKKTNADISAGKGNLTIKQIIESESQNL